MVLGEVQGATEEEISQVIPCPRSYQWIAGVGKNNPLGGPWTTVMILSFTLLIWDCSISIIFNVSYSVKSPKSFYFYQVWGSGGIVGIFLFIFAALLGVGLIYWVQILQLI